MAEMNDAECELAAQLAAHPRWRWQKGMHFIPVSRLLNQSWGSSPASVVVDVDVVGSPEYGVSVALAGDGLGSWYDDMDHELIPDISSPATQGWLLYMADEVLGDTNHITWSGDKSIFSKAPTRGMLGAHILLAAWEAADEA